MWAANKVIKATITSSYCFEKVHLQTVESWGNIVVQMIFVYPFFF